MRLLCALGCLVWLTGCAGPHSTGALWAQQNLERESALFKLTDGQRAEQIHASELALADEALSGERARIMGELGTCPGQREALRVSAGDTVRDVIRLRAQNDGVRLGATARLALADWRVRRARATGNARFCQDAEAVLTGSDSGPQATSSQLPTRLPSAIVTRDPRHTASAPSTTPAAVTLSLYALGYLDTVQGAAPLPQYLAAVYGGHLLVPDPAPVTDDETAAALVDQEASAYPEWEPDALYAALRGVSQ